MKLILSFWMLASSTIVNGQCSVCGDGKEVGKPDAIFKFPGQPEVPCDILQAAGQTGQISQTQCDFLPSVINPICECQNKVMRQPSSSSVCSICGEGKFVGNTEAIFAFPGQPSISCGDLEFNGNFGILTTDQCNLYSTLVGPLCECQEAAPPCSICGDRREVGNPDSIFAFPGQLATSCGDLEKDGKNGIVLGGQCDVLPQLIGPLCNCQPIVEKEEEEDLAICSICGDGKEVGNTDTIFSFPGQPAVTCGILEDDGKQGLIPKNECTVLPNLIGILCECQSTLVMAPNNTNTKPPTTNVSAEDIACSVCGDGKEVNNNDAIFAFPGQPAITCGTLEEVGEGGLIPSTQCAFLPDLINELCDCQPSNGGGSITIPVPPLQTQEPTPGPTIEPTPGPTIEPTPGPTPKLTLEPRPEPTLEPTQLPTPFPTVRPSILASLAPSARSDAPTQNPTLLPTLNPTSTPTKQPAPAPTLKPTTNSPTTISPTGIPTDSPTVSPTDSPTTQIPTTLAPIITTTKPTKTPTLNPTVMPTATTSTTPPSILLQLAPSLLSSPSSPTSTGKKGASSISKKETFSSKKGPSVDTQNEKKSSKGKVPQSTFSKKVPPQKGKNPKEQKVNNKQTKMKIPKDKSEKKKNKSSKV
eukprot:CAMPEP_0194169052 /NCGR_PEP_ID=MMETSP0154-20130528/3763_1 /TAXON_ID=1049557 /ORGANISM="Thalassiothrix antarctica, Strain L6-D1" /LENGTH=640 /DNA_ID=CAMNT_0038880287 /DNA_START=86 /DNA_END=2008 /DNA_ORIENTATION=-